MYFWPNFKINYQIFCQMYTNCHKQQNKQKQKNHLKVTRSGFLSPPLAYSMSLLGQQPWSLFW